MTNAPAVSVIIPLYNAEKYVGECLDSLLMQTFQDFEIILVNDCSTDKSRAVAESYAPKFGGRLKIFDNQKNSGAGVTRNNGLRLAGGEYVYFMDSDDMILLNALEKMYSIAKQFDVDVVHLMGYYLMSEDGKELVATHIKKPAFESEFLPEQDLEWRMKNLLANGGATVRKFSRREFLIKNELFFPENIKTAEDTVWTHGLWCLAKKIVHTQSIFYLYRTNPNSLTKSKVDPLVNIKVRVRSIVIAQKWIDNVMDKAQFFAENPQYRYIMLNHLTKLFFTRLFKGSLGFSQDVIYHAIKEEFDGTLGKYDVLVTELCSLINDQQKEIGRLKTQLENT